MEKDLVKPRECCCCCFLCWIRSAFGTVFLKRPLVIGGILTETKTAPSTEGCPPGQSPSRAKEKSQGRLGCYKRTSLDGLREGHWAWFSRRGVLACAELGKKDRN